MDVQQPIIVWCGRFHTHDGYGSAARLHVGALREIGAPVVAVDVPSWSVVGPVDGPLVRVDRSGSQLQIRAVDPDRAMTTVVHERPDNYPRVTIAGRAQAIGYSYWETAGLPRQWAGWMTSMDKIWASSEFNRAGFAAAGVPDWMVGLVGIPLDNLAVEVAESRAEHRRRWKEQTVFLSVASSVIGRRDLNLLLDAYTTAFDADDDVALVLKVPQKGAEGVSSILERLLVSRPERASGSWPAVYLVPADLTREQLVRLHASVDCYVSCERGDGWDLPAMDSLTLGVPVVTSDFGASTEFIDPADCYVVNTTSRMVACDDAFDGSHPLYSGQYWPYVQSTDLASVLRDVHGDPQRRDRVAAAAKERVSKTYDRRRVARDVLELAMPSSEVDLRSNSPAVVTVHKSPKAWNETRSYTEMRDHPTLSEDALLGTLMDPDFLTPRDPRAFARVYKRASSFAVSHDAALEKSSVRRTLSGAMQVSARSPLRKAMAVSSARHSVRRELARRDDSAELRNVAEIAADYERSVETGSSKFAPEALEQLRRPIWGRYGPFVSPSDDLHRLSELRNKHLGERVFILGNGPSLVKCDLARLENEFTFGVNKIYLLFDQIDWRPTYYTLLDWKMGAAIQDDLGQLTSSTKFFPERFRGVLPPGPDTYWYWPRLIGTHIDDQFEPNLADGVPSRATVLVTAIQQAFFLGFREIYLIGVDASYVIPESVKQSGPDRFGTGIRLNLESTADDDPNHFAPTYFGKGARWHDPNVADMRRLFRMMRKGVERHGGALLNATVGGSLEELDRVDFDGLF